MTDHSRDPELSLEGLVESAALEYVRDCAKLPEAVRLWTETGGDDSGEDNAPEEERGTPCVKISAEEEEEQWTSSGTFLVLLSLELRATNQQLPKSAFSAAFKQVQHAMQAAVSHGLDSETTDFNATSMENATTGATEYEGKVRSKALTYDVYCTDLVGADGAAAILTEDGGHYIVTEG